MKYTPDAVVDLELDIARAAYFGGEFAVYVSQKPAVMLGEIRLSASGTATFLKTEGAAIIGDDADLQMNCATPINSDVDLVAIIAGMDNTAATPVTQDGTATFSAPARAGNQSSNFARGFAVDIEATKKFTTVTGLGLTTPIVGGGVNQILRVYQLPEAADYELIEATMEIDFNTKDRAAKGIDAGMESDKWVKRGKAQPGELSIGSKWRSFVEGMARYSGQKCTVMLVGVKEGQVTCDRLVFTQYTGTIRPKAPDGDGEATMEVTGKYVDHLFFIAP